MKQLKLTILFTYPFDLLRFQSYEAVFVVDYLLYSASVRRHLWLLPLRTAGCPFPSASKSYHASVNHRFETAPEISGTILSSAVGFQVRWSPVGSVENRGIFNMIDFG